MVCVLTRLPLNANDSEEEGEEDEEEEKAAKNHWNWLDENKEK